MISKWMLRVRDYFGVVIPKSKDERKEIIMICGIHNLDLED